ncbi:MAG: CbiX/SirB N-terminal domain-containing protein [Deltaproteobacteria bacterium]|nr:CbiX/SirB N-terminal domain-containing protein [Deltaproteobacteria bacterium]
MEKESIVLLGHGSRRSEANNILKSIVKIIKPKFLGINIEYAFLELAEPNIRDIIEKLVANRYDSIYVIPYFLYSGNHVSRDIPEILGEYREKYPDIKLKLGDYLGIDERLAELVMERIESIKLA